MPRPSKGARLYKRKTRYSKGKLVGQPVWLIKDGDRNIATGCIASASQTRPPREAEQALADYIAKKYQPERNRRDIEDIDCADVLSIYLSDVGEPADQFEISARIGRLNEFWGGKTLSAVNAQTCGRYAKHRGNQGGARRDLETLRAAINHHAKEGFHRGVVRVSLPPKGEARDRWLTRNEAAALIWHCWRHREKQTVHTADLLVHARFRHHHASIHGRLRPVRGGIAGIDRNPAMIQCRVSEGSITSSISSTEAIETALPLA